MYILIFWNWGLVLNVTAVNLFFVDFLHKYFNANISYIVFLFVHVHIKALYVRLNLLKLRASFKGDYCQS